MMRIAFGWLVSVAVLMAGASGSAGEQPTRTEFPGSDAGQNAGHEDRPWWLSPHRMLQTNLREIDATMDLDQYVRDIKDFHADVVLFNVGGIVANYPTELEYHYRNTFMKGDLVGEVIKRLHAEGVRVIGRFDFSKINEKFAAQRPEWLYRSEKGQLVNYNGQVHTCVSGGYQQEYLFKILGEAVDRYPLDGVFFNMIGYRTRDYSGNYHGLCQCDACRTRFHDYCGLPLPARQDSDDPASAKHQQFCREMVARQFRRISEFLKEKRPDLAICTYTDAGVDVIRKESNRPTADWLYTDSEKAQTALATYPDKMLANAAVHFLEIPHRHAGTTPFLTARRLLQHMVNGTWVDFYCIGPVHRLEDRMALDVVRGIYRFHAQNERWLAPTRSLAQVALVKRAGAEYEGFFQILSERHIPFEVVPPSNDNLSEYPVLIIPEAGNLDRASCERIDRHVRSGGRVLLSGKSPLAAQPRRTHEREQGTYVRIRPQDKTELQQPTLETVDLVYLDGDLQEYELTGSARGLLRFVPVGMYGPPEKCYYTETSDVPALILNQHQDGLAALFPWPIGEHYRRLCHPAHATLAIGALEGLLGLTPRVEVTASPLVEVNHRRDLHGRFEWISLLNHTGQNGNAVHPPVAMSDVVVRVKTEKPITNVRLLNAERTINFETDGPNWIRCTIPELQHYEVVLFEYAE